MPSWLARPSEQSGHLPNLTQGLHMPPLNQDGQAPRGVVRPLTREAVVQ